MDEKNDLAVLNIPAIITRINERKKSFYWVIPITFVLSSALILCVPRYYSSSITLAPEAQKTNMLGSVGALASSFGIDFGSMTNDDAIYPSIYPDVVESQDFILSLFSEKVETADGSFQGDIYSYISDNYRLPWWGFVFSRMKNRLSELISPVPSRMNSGEEQAIDPFWLSKKEQGTVTRLKDNITCYVDKKTDLITITTTAQDPLACAQLTRHVSAHLQAFITDYRTSKTAKDIEYYSKMEALARQEYDRASKAYIDFVDSHSNMNLEHYKIEEENLRAEKDMQFSMYEGFTRQMLIAQSKLHENTPVYTIVEDASVPLKPSGPRRVIFVLGMCILACTITFVWETRDLLHITL